MSTLQFVASLVKSLAWPTAAVVVAVVFRKSITAVMQRFTRVKYKELEFVFKEELKSIASALSPAHSLTTETELSGITSVDVKGEFKAVAEVSPRAAIPLAWGSVEAELQEALFRVADSPVDVPMFNIRQQLAGLQQRGFLDAETARGIHRFVNSEIVSYTVIFHCRTYRRKMLGITLNWQQPQALSFDRLRNRAAGLT